MKESTIQIQIMGELRMLENSGLLLFERTNNISRPIQRQTKTGIKTGYFKTGRKGSSDIKVYLPEGKTLHLETKKEDGRQSPEQKEWQGKLERLRHIYRVARSVEQLKTVLAEICPEVFKHVYQMK